VLTIRGEKKAERREEDDDAQYYLVERSYGGFQRSFTLPSTVDPDSVRAEFNNGVLNIHLKKQATGRPRGREIPIAAQSNGGGQRVTSSSRTEGQPRGNQGSNRGEAQTTQSTPNRETTGRSSRT
jgi:HSP20 family protein